MLNVSMCPPHSSRGDVVGLRGIRPFRRCLTAFHCVLVMCLMCCFWCVDLRCQGFPVRLLSRVCVRVSMGAIHIQ
eukprot:jgi/Mesvir1/7085/Mv26521-RA.1